MAWLGEENDVQALFGEPELKYVMFRLDGTNNPDLIVGQGVTVARTGTANYAVTFPAALGDVVSAMVTHELTTTTLGTAIMLREINETTGEVKLNIKRENAGGNLGDNDGTIDNSLVHLLLWCRTSGRSF